MKIKFLLFFAGIFLLVAGCNEQAVLKNNSIRAADKRLSELLDQKEYFRLEDQLNLFRDSIDNKRRLYFQSFVDNAFNRNAASVAEIETLLKNYDSSLTDSAKAALNLLENDDYFKLFQYGKAAQSLHTVLNRYTAALDSEKVDDIKNDLLIRIALQNIPPQELTIQDSTVIHWKKDKIGLVEFPVKFNAATYDCIFDTRANISSISQTYAAKLGLKMLDASYEEGSGITGIRFKTGLGIADSLYIGNILVRNAVFQVMPDSILYLAPIKFSLNIIIGFPVIAALKEIHLYKNGTMIIPLTPSKNTLHNLALDGLDPVISLKTGNDTLCFHLDLGAASTDLYYAYFEKYKPQILAQGYLKTVEYGGAGGSQKKNVYVLPKFSLYLQNREIIIDSVNVLTQKIFPKERFYGNLGQDFTNKFNEITLDFTYMYISVISK